MDDRPRYQQPFTLEEVRQLPVPLITEGAPPSRVPPPLTHISLKFRVTHQRTSRTTLQRLRACRTRSRTYGARRTSYRTRSRRLRATRTSSKRSGRTKSSCAHATTPARSSEPPLRRGGRALLPSSLQVANVAVAPFSFLSSGSQNERISMLRIVLAEKGIVGSAHYDLTPPVPAVSPRPPPQNRQNGLEDDADLTHNATGMANGSGGSDIEGADGSVYL